MKSVFLLTFGAVFAAAGLAVTVLLGQTNTLACDRVKSNQVNCLLGEAEIHQLQSARVESFSGRGKTHRVMVVGRNGNFPLTSYYSSGRSSKKQMADLINAFIAEPSQPSLEVRETRWLVFILGGVFVLTGLYIMVTGVFAVGDTVSEPPDFSRLPATFRRGKFGKYQTIEIHRDRVRVGEKGLFAANWEEPVSAFKGVLCRTRTSGGFTGSAITSHLVELVHPDRAKTLLLYMAPVTLLSKAKETSHKLWRDATRALDLPALDDAVRSGQSTLGRTRRSEMEDVMNEPTLDTLTQRLDRLEGEVRWWKVLGTATMAVLALVLLLGAAGPAVTDEIRAKRLIGLGDFLAGIINSGFDDTASRLHALHQDMQAGFATLAEDLNVIRTDIWDIRTDLEEVKISLPALPQPAAETEQAP